jgi:hypothetical protein
MFLKIFQFPLMLGKSVYPLEQEFKTLTKHSKCLLFSKLKPQSLSTPVHFNILLQMRSTKLFNDSLGQFLQTMGFSLFYLYAVELLFYP